MAVLAPNGPTVAPDFLIVGAAKAGTTALHSYLAQHPAIAVTHPKETFFFAREEIEGCTGVGSAYALRPIPNSLAAYLECFRGGPTAQLRGESCVAYLYFPLVAARIRAANPACKIIMLLRNPVERAFSNYVHHVRDGLEPLSFLSAVEGWPERRAQGWWFGFDYAGGGEYAAQLATFQREFRPEQIHICSYDDFRLDPAATCRAIFTFLGVAPGVSMDTRAELNVSLLLRPRWRVVDRAMAVVAPALRATIGRRQTRAIVNRVRRKGSYRPRLSAVDRAVLEARFEPEVRRLEHLTGRDLSAWRTIKGR